MSQKKWKSFGMTGYRSGKVKLTESKDTAKFFNNIFKYGSSKSEEELLKQATGKTLDVDAYCKQFKAE